MIIVTVIRLGDGQSKDAALNNDPVAGVASMQILETSDDESDYSLESDSDGSLDMSDGEYDTDIKEVGGCDFFTSILDTICDATDVFSLTEMKALKERERAVAERQEEGYYRCKRKHAKLYQQLSSLRWNVVLL